MDIVLFVIYIFLLILSLAYSGVIAYHVLKYRHQLRERESRQTLVILTAYLVVGGGILLLSIILAVISGLII